MSSLVLWRLLPLLSLLHFSALAELNYRDSGRGAAPFIFTNTGPEYGLGENAIADSWDISPAPPQYGFDDNIAADPRGEGTDEANSLQLNLAIAPPSDQAQSPESAWLSESLHCPPTSNPIPNKKRRARRQSDRICPAPTDMYETQPAPLVIPQPILRQDRKPTKNPNSAPKPKPILKGDPVDDNEWICGHLTVNYPVCADYKHATETPLGSGSYDLLMAKLCEDPFYGHFPSSICCFRIGDCHYSLHPT